MTWVGWRQQRTETLIAAAIVVLVAAALVPSGLQMASAYHRDDLGSCLGEVQTRACNAAVDSFTSRFQQTGDLLGWLTVLPGLIGVLLAAPFVLQLESGGYRLDWTQGITRGRWIATKLALAVIAAVLASLAFVAVVSWWWRPLVHLHGRMNPSVFDSGGPVVFGYTLFALGLGLAVGVVWRRSVAALVVGFVGYFVARIAVDTWLRQRLTPPASITWPGQNGEPAALRHAWVISEGSRDLQRRAGGQLQAIYEPASRYWHMQGVELALFAGVAVLLIVASAWWTHTRTG